MNYDLISKNRKGLMGFAVLWIAFLHATMWFSTVPLQAYKLTGHAGVEIFLFLSSFGLYYAWQKGERGKQFFLKRLIRILPAYWIVSIFRAWYLKYSALNTVLLFTTMNFWFSYDRSTWFISAILVLYALTPLYLSWLTKGREELKTAMIIAVCLILGIILRNTKLMIFIASTPVYFLGFLAGKYAREKRKISRNECIIGMVLLFAGLFISWISHCYDVNENVLWGWGMYWYPSLLFTWPLCILLSRAAEGCRKIHCEFIPSIFEKLGEVSLEFYLLHELMIKFFSNIIVIADRYNYHGIIFNLLIIFLTYWIARALHQLLNLLIKPMLRKYAA